MPTYLRLLLERAIILVWLPLAVSMTFLVIWSMTFLPTSGRLSTDTVGAPQRFVCTADGDGTLLRCSFSTIAKPPISAP